MATTGFLTSSIKGKNMMQAKKNTAVFLDRDGTINEEVGYLDSIDKLKLFPNAAAAIRIINESGMKAVVMSNQSGIARGYFTEEFVGTVHTHIQKTLRERGAFIDAFYYCPHHPTDGLGAYLKSCSCRKPEAGMLIAASEDLDIDLGKSYTVGDMSKDIQVAGKVGAKGVLVKTGYGVNTIEKDFAPGSAEVVRPDYIAEDILDAITWIMRDRQ
jgi:D-glycero-D-manno-heptose 1,7-bisphosphate phosphatase